MFSAYQHSNKWNQTSDFSIKESSKSTPPSIQLLIEELRAQILQESELEKRDFSELIALLTTLAKNDCHSDVASKCYYN